MKTIKKYGKTVVWFLLSVLFLLCCFYEAPIEYPVILKVVIYTFLFSCSLFLSIDSLLKVISDRKDIEGDFTGYDAESIREKSLSRIQLPKDVIENLKYTIDKAIEEGHTSAKFVTYPKNPDGSNTQSVRNYLLLHGFSVIVDKKGGHFVIIKWA